MVQQKIIGRKDKIDLPDFDLLNISVKIDSGAYSCSIHCNLIEEVELDGQKQLKVVFLDENQKKYTGVPHYFLKYNKKPVKSSTGEKQNRFFIQAKIVLFGEEFITDFSLTQRDGLKNPILIGRKILNGKFVIDTSKVNLSFKEKKSKNLK